MSDSLAQSSAPAMAERPDKTHDGNGEDVGVRDFLAFTVGDEQYALPLSAVREILKPPAVTEVPFAPRNILGIISVRGRVTTLVDLRRKLQMPETALTIKSRVILVDKGEEVLGLLVDEVLQVYRLREDEVEMASVMGRDLAEYVMGIGRPSRRTYDINDTAAFSENFASSSASRALEREASNDRSEMLILLDPVALLKG
jgi:purine-binding chemotaxis protein CheW